VYLATRLRGHVAGDMVQAPLLGFSSDTEPIATGELFVSGLRIASMPSNDLKSSSAAGSEVCGVIPDRKVASGSPRTDALYSPLSILTFTL
jgi:hypothetical protein